MPSKASKAQPVALRVELLDIDPLIWRRIIVANNWTLASLHHYLQWVMGWSDTHAHEFHAGSQVVAPEWWIEEIGFDNDTANYRNERRISVGALIAELGLAGEFEYHHDMGDGWRHRIVVETVPVAWREFELPLPVCTAGEHACPPEDVGGPHGYKKFRAAISNAEHEEFGALLNWIGGVFDPKGFDINRINKEWRAAKRRRGWANRSANRSATDRPTDR